MGNRWRKRDCSAGSVARKANWLPELRISRALTGADIRGQQREGSVQHDYPRTMNSAAILQPAGLCVVHLRQPEVGGPQMGSSMPGAADVSLANEEVTGEHLA